MTATFIRVEGICPVTAAHVAGDLALQSRTLADKAWRTAAAWSSRPLALGGLLDDDDATRLAWIALRGVSEDRVAVLAESVVARLETRIDPLLRELVARRRALGDHVVLLTDLPDAFAEPLLADLDADELWSNRLEVRAGRLTGALASPLVASRLAATALRDWSENTNRSLQHCTAYAARGSDLALLSAVGNPCAVRPDRHLASAARRFGWPVEVQA
jgi:phosphoserine phosphatase